MRYYNIRPGVYAGTPGNPDRCAAEVFVDCSFSHQCCRRRTGSGPHDEFCKQHANMLTEGRQVDVPMDEREG